MNKIFVLILFLATLFVNPANAVMIGRVGGFRRFVFPSINRVQTVNINKSHSTINTHSITNESNIGIMPWVFYGYIITRSIKDGKISCDCSSLENDPELFEECVLNCPVEE